MKNILQKIFLFFALLLFGWGYGQICIQENNQRIVSSINYPSVSAIPSSILPSNTANNNTSTTNIVDNDLSTFTNYVSTNPSYTSGIPGTFTQGIGSGTITIENLYIKNGEIIHFEIGEYDRINTAGTGTVTYTISTEKNNVRILNNVAIQPEFPLSEVLLSNRNGSFMFTTNADIDKIIVIYNLSKPAQLTTTTQIPIS